MPILTRWQARPPNIWPSTPWRGRARLVPAVPVRQLALPWFTTEQPGPGINEYLWHSSPAEFRWRNIFTESRPFRRASQRATG